MPVPHSTPSTPPLRSRSRAIKSFENLVALANDERTRNAVWRPRGQPVAPLPDLNACIHHAAVGGARAATLAFSIRASFNVVLVLIRWRSISAKRLLRAIFGLDSARFAAMFGVFVSTYRLLLNVLPSKPESGTATPSTPFIRKPTRRRHAALAGFIAGGLAISLEKRSRRILIAQQLFARGLQASWISQGWVIPNGDVIVFSLACAQIMYAFLLRPDTLPHSYASWVSHASHVSAPAIHLNHRLVRENILDTGDIKKLLARSDITPANATELASLAAAADFPRYAPCAAIHPAETSCLDVPTTRFVDVFRMMLPLYAALHVIPAVLFKRNLFMKDPPAVLIKAILGSFRSSAFLGTYVTIYQTINCSKHQLHTLLTSKFGPLPIFDAMLISKWTFVMPGLFAGMALFIEEKRRRPELAMYVLPRALESAWTVLSGKVGITKTLRGGESALAALGMAMVMNAYQNNPQNLSGLVRKILYQFVGPN